MSLDIKKITDEYNLNQGNASVDTETNVAPVSKVLIFFQ